MFPLAKHVQDHNTQSNWIEIMANRLLQEIVLNKKKKELDDSNNDDGGNDCEGHGTANDATDVTTLIPDDTTFMSFDTPYSRTFHAEEEEDAFEILKSLLENQEEEEQQQKRKRHNDRISPSEASKNLFGSYLARNLIKENALIQKSGYLFCEDWKQQKKKGRAKSSSCLINKLNLISDNLLLLLLSKGKLVNADLPSLKRVVTGFDLWTLLPNLLDDWGLESCFPELYTGIDATQPSLHSSKMVLQCLIFVSRSYHIMHALKWTNIRGTSAQKVLRCLEILDQHVVKVKTKAPAEQKRAKRKTNATSVTVNDGTSKEDDATDNETKLNTSSSLPIKEKRNATSCKGHQSDSSSTDDDDDDPGVGGRQSSHAIWNVTSKRKRRRSSTSTTTTMTTTTTVELPTIPRKKQARLDKSLNVAARHNNNVTITNNRMGSTNNSSRQHHPNTTHPNNSAIPTFRRSGKVSGPA